MFGLTLEGCGRIEDKLVRASAEDRACLPTSQLVAELEISRGEFELAMLQMVTVCCKVQLPQQCMEASIPVRNPGE